MEALTYAKRRLYTLEGLALLLGLGYFFWPAWGLLALVIIALLALIYQSWKVGNMERAAEAARRRHPSWRENSGSGDHTREDY